MRMIRSLAMFGACCFYLAVSAGCGDTSPSREPEGPVDAMVSADRAPVPRTIVIYKEEDVLKYNIHGWHSVTEESLDAELHKLGVFGVDPKIEIKVGAGVPAEKVEDLVTRIEQRYAIPPTVHD